MITGVVQFSERVQSICFSLKISNLERWTHPEVVILDGADQRIVASWDRNSFVSRITPSEKTILYLHLHTELNYPQFNTLMLVHLL